MKRTSGPWALRGYQIRADGGAGKHVATYQTNRLDGLAIAAVPELLDLLDDACRSLDAAESSASCHTTAFYIRERMHKLGIWRPAYDRAGYPNYTDDPASIDPDVELSELPFPERL